MCAWASAWLDRNGNLTGYRAASIVTFAPDHKKLSCQP